jgi:SAM-dependent methyltransferase
MAAWVEHADTRPIRVAEINRIDGIHDQLARLPGFISSDYQPGSARGAIVDGIRSEDLGRLTFADSSFDLVLTSETLEHVPDLDSALSEIRRVLVPGGRHIFTIPMIPGIATTYARSVVRSDGALRHVAPRICHPGGDTGYPVFTEFGADLPQLHARAGFELETHFGPPSDLDLAQVYVARPIDR